MDVVDIVYTRVYESVLPYWWLQYQINFWLLLLLLLLFLCIYATGDHLFAMVTILLVFIGRGCSLATFKESVLFLFVFFLL